MNTYWYIFNENGEIISEAYETEEEAITAMTENDFQRYNGFDQDEPPAFVDGIES